MKILMYLNIPWEFIKQRPQFLAEKLSRYVEVAVYYNKPYKKTYIVKEKCESNHIKLIGKRKVPRKNNFLKRIDNYLQRKFIKEYVKENDIIWIMHPYQYEILKPVLSSKKVVYDCMDDYSRFPNLQKKEVANIYDLEKELVQRADYIFYASETLKIIYKKRYNITKHTFVINNALEHLNGFEEDRDIKDYLEKINKKKFIYIGAIAPWFDFESILQALEESFDICFVLFGPIDCEIPSHDRIHYYGKIPHKSIYTAMKYADTLIMPFKVNNLIKAVDPIKIYEYIASGKPVIASAYEEMKKFKQFIYTYRDEEELAHLVNKKIEACNEEKIKQFIAQNTWEVRAQQIVQILQHGAK